MIAKRIRFAALILGPLAALLLAGALLRQGLSTDIAITAMVTIWCVIWWVFEPIPIPVTSLLPLALKTEDQRENQRTGHVRFLLQ